MGEFCQFFFAISKIWSANDPAVFEGIFHNAVFNDSAITIRYYRIAHFTPCQARNVNQLSFGLPACRCGPSLKEPSAKVRSRPSQLAGFYGLTFQRQVFLSPSLQKARDRFEIWRRSKKPGSQIPNGRGNAGAENQLRSTRCSE